ncbi:MAG: hypothetical protein H0V93_14705 [Euzebyales bacterium]|nr:hypothetical protein [Euzebyales bacterium]
MQYIELIVQAEKTIHARHGIIANDDCRTPGYRLDRLERPMIDRFSSNLTACSAASREFDRWGIWRFEHG